MISPPARDLAALGLSLDMLGPPERLHLPLFLVDEAQGVMTLQSRFCSLPAPLADLLDARSDVLRTLGIELQFDADSQALSFTSPETLAFRIRPAHRDSTPWTADADGRTRLVLRQAGRFLVETPDGLPLALGHLDPGVLTLALVGAWPAPPLDDWIAQMNDSWLQTVTEQTLPGADPWTRTALAGQITRLATHELPDVAVATAAGGGISALLGLVSALPAMHPRMWARTLDARALAAIEEHARRRAVALEDDLQDLLDTLSADPTGVRRIWTRLCHRRDDIEGVRVLLREGGLGDTLDALLRGTDRVGRSARINLVPGVDTDDERLRRVALADPSAWWGDTFFEARLV